MEVEAVRVEAGRLAAVAAAGTGAVAVAVAVADAHTRLVSVRKGFFRVSDLARISTLREVWRSSFKKLFSAGSGLVRLLPPAF